MNEDTDARPMPQPSPDAPSEPAQEQTPPPPPPMLRTDSIEADDQPPELFVSGNAPSRLPSSPPPPPPPLKTEPSERGGEK
jgi:hypothetical protein